jgi:hypothetical protein
MAVVNHEVVSSTSSSSSSNKTVTVTCPTGKVVLGGGALLPSGGYEAYLVVYNSYPSATNAWTVQVVEGDSLSSSWSFTAYAVCATN